MAWGARYQPSYLWALCADTDPSWWWMAGKFVDPRRVNHVCANAKMPRVCVRHGRDRAMGRHHAGTLAWCGLCKVKPRKAKIYEKNLLIWSLNKKRLTVRRATATTCYHRFDRPSDRAAAQSCWPSAATVRSNWSRSSNDTNWSRFGMLSTDALQGNGTHHS